MEKSDNNKNNNKNNVGSAWGPVSGSNNYHLLTIFNIRVVSDFSFALENPESDHLGLSV